MSDKVYFILQKGCMDAYTYDKATAKYYVKLLNEEIKGEKYELKPIKIDKLSNELLTTLHERECETELSEYFRYEDLDKHVVVLNAIDYPTFDIECQTTMLNTFTNINKLIYSLHYIKLNDDERTLIDNTFKLLLDKKNEWEDYIESNYFEEPEAFGAEKEFLDVEQVYRRFIRKYKR